MKRLCFVRICALILLTVSSACAHAFQDDSLAEQIKNDQMADTNFNYLMNLIIVAERNPKYAHWKADIVAFSADANRMLQETKAVRSKCIAAKIIHSQPCDGASFGQGLLLGEMGAISALGDPDQPNDDVEDIRSQINRWSATDFADACRRIAQRAPVRSTYQADIARAAAYRDAAEKAAEENDWIGGIISLRRSQLILDDALTRTLLQSSK
jgi:hypothetical protein